MKKRHVYGPVPSRRLGLSLGVDLLPIKTCCYDCCYCQVGPTTALTTDVQPFFDPEHILFEVKHALRNGPAPEVISLAGSGEPTLFACLDVLVHGLRRLTHLPLALLTNGALLWQSAIAETCTSFDIVLPSLDAGDAETFQRINRPSPDLALDQVLSGLVSFTHHFHGSCRLEIMLIKEQNDSVASLKQLAQIAGALEVSSIDLNTVVRPPAHGVSGLGAEEMNQALAFFSGSPAIVVADLPAGPDRTNPSPRQPLDQHDQEEVRQRIFATLTRRPCTINDLRLALGLEEPLIQEICQKERHAGQLSAVWVADRLYYRHEENPPLPGPRKVR